MNRLADDVFQVPLMPRDAINAYLIGDVLVDAGYPFHGKKLVGALRGRPVGTHVLTHAHADHAGGSRRVCDDLRVPLWCGAADAEAAATGRAVNRGGVAGPLLKLYMRWSPVAVAKDLREGDQVGPGFTVLDVPGQSPGHIALWRERDRVLICGDVFFNMHILTLVPGLHEPPAL
jgi:hydroxyacylglutathione hydrolase